MLGVWGGEFGSLKLLSEAMYLHWRQETALSLTPLTLAEQESFPAQEGAMDGTEPRGAAQRPSDIAGSPFPSDVNWKGRAVVPTSGASSGLLPLSSVTTPFLGLGLGPALLSVIFSDNE